MDFENLMKIFDSCWFQMEILKSQPRSSSLSVFDEANPDQENEGKRSKPVISRIPTRHKRSVSADLMSSSKTSFDSVAFSPDSVLFTPKLQTIISGKESTEGDEEHQEQERKPAHHDCQECVSKKKAAARTRRRKRISSETKSMSDLEFEELKGFMDLGFVFTEEDNKDSRLVEIVPGLQRLGRKLEDKMEESSDIDHDESAISRPYLSEAWDVLDTRKREKNPLLMDWKIPALSNEIDMKDNLRWWAHTVASTVIR
ncbi:hypothetical protein ACOSP7_011780 [Xanthoceras sorbifolium]|uniref:Uncharacterized protein n=1 Tax=Xanthoceras sorbifolium TaxID=99658 RepID=A0ABQ8HWP2_9ROSI|nr:hypothetical protein JRO89_XS06G0041800 [Xanthoceras sorbifolium]